MKVIQIILAVYILGMVVYPCRDVDTSLEVNKTHIIVAESASHNDTNNAADACTPFCICSCCATHIQISNTSSIIALHQVSNSEPITHYLSSSVVYSARSIWQPPKI